jgi:hypothetical protein
MMTRHWINVPVLPALWSLTWSVQSPRVLEIDCTAAGRAMRWSLPCASSQAVPLVFQLDGADKVSALPVAGVVMVQARSAGCEWFRQMSTDAEATVCKLQFWLSQVADMPVEALSGIWDPLGEEGTAHMDCESQVALVLADGLDVLPPPPQLTRSAAVQKRRAVHGDDRIHDSESVDKAILQQGAEGSTVPLSTNGPLHMTPQSARSQFGLAIICACPKPDGGGALLKDMDELEYPSPR